MKGKKVACYIRVSCESQSKGLASQKAAINEWLEGFGLSERASFYSDHGESGKDMDRPAWKKLQRDVFLGKIDTVVAWKIDRIGRNLKEGINAICDLLDKNIRLVAVAQQFDFAGTTGRMIASVLLGVAEMERGNIRDNVARGLQEAKRRGVQLGRRPVADVASVRELRNAGVSVNAISKKLGVSRQAVYSALNS